MAVEMTQVDSIIEAHGTGRGRLIGILLELQRTFSHLAPEALERVADRLNIPLMQVYAVARFYRAFSLEPRPPRSIRVCTGTACFVRGGGALLHEVERLTHLTPGEVTDDGQLTLETPSCPGSCPAGPVMAVNGTAHGRVSASQAASLLSTSTTANEATANE